MLGRGCWELALGDRVVVVIFATVVVWWNRRSGETGRGWRSGLGRSFTDPAGRRRIWHDGRRRSRLPEKLVAARTGLTQEDAKARVDAVLKRADEAARQAKRAAETARKAGATFALVGALSLFVGAFIASAAAALGGRLRDANEGALGPRS